MRMAIDDFGNEGYVDIKFIAKYLGFKVSTIRDWVKRKEIPFYRIGGGLRFILKEVNEVIQKKHMEK